MTLFNGLGWGRGWVLLTVGTLVLGLTVKTIGNRQVRGRAGGEGLVDGEVGSMRNLEQAMHVVTARIQGKARIADEVLAGRMEFLEAAASFRTLDRIPLCHPETSSLKLFAGDSEEERYCRAVILWVRVALERSNPCLSTETCEQMEEQLTEHLRRGPLRLPEVDAGALRRACEID